MRKGKVAQTNNGKHENGARRQILYPECEIHAQFGIHTAHTRMSGMTPSGVTAGVLCGNVLALGRSEAHSMRLRMRKGREAQTTERERRGFTTAGGILAQCGIHTAHTHA